MKEQRVVADGKLLVEDTQQLVLRLQLGPCPPKPAFLLRLDAHEVLLAPKISRSQRASMAPTMTSGSGFSARLASENTSRSEMVGALNLKTGNNIYGADDRAQACDPVTIGVCDVDGAVGVVPISYLGFPPCARVLTVAVGSSPGFGTRAARVYALALHTA
eukprot:5603756-Prymnesium_polylepis.1